MEAIRHKSVYKKKKNRKNILMRSKFSFVVKKMRNFHNFHGKN